MSNVKISLTSRPQRSIKLRPQLRFADEILKSSKCSTLTSDEQSPSGESIGSDYVAFSSPESSSSSRSQTDTKDFTAVFKVADKVRVMAQILDVDSLHLLAEILIPCLENMLRSFKRLSSRIRSTPDFGVAFRGAIFSGRMFAHHIEKVTTRLSGIQLADAIQLSLQSLDMMVESLKVLFGLIEHSVSEAKPLPNVPVVSTPNTTLARPLTPESSVENSPVPPMPYPEQAAVPLPLAMPITDGPSIPMPPTGKAATKGSLRRLVSGLGRRSSLGPLTLWSGTVFSKTPAMALALRVGGPPKGLVSTRPGMPGLSHSETSDQQTHISSAPPTTDQSTLVLRNLLQVLDKNQPSSTAELYFSSGGILCAASLAALVRILTSTEAIKDSIFDDFFFLSFRFFSSPIEIFNLLVAQYDEGPLGPLNSGHTILWEQDAPVAKVRVAKVFLLWLRRHWRYQWDADILEPLRQFVSNRPAHDPASITWGKVLRKLNEASSANYRGSRIQQTAETGVTHDAPANLPRPFGLLAEEAIFRGDFDEVDIIHFRSPAGRKELARQLCLAASELFRHIDPEDAVRYWNDGRDKKAGERILQLASFENAQAYWTSHSIVIRPTARSRAEVMELFIDLASQCRKLRNFASASAISTGVNLCMTRLRETTGAMSDSHKALAIELENLFVLHRSGLVLEQGPAIPLISTFKHDIEVSSGMKAVREPLEWSGKVLIDLERYRVVARTIQVMELCHARYNFRHISGIHKWLQRVLLVHICRSSKENLRLLDNLSNLVEPKV